MDLSLADIEKMRKFWGKMVTIKGKAQYQPSGKLRSIEAQLVKPFEPGEEILQRVPRRRRKGLEFGEEFFLEKNSNKSLKKIWGKWPDDESINDLLSALHERPA